MEGQPGPSQQRICAVHIGDTRDPVKPFNQQTLEKCRKSLRVRSYHNLSYCNFELPADLNDDTKGFHPSCYNKFTAVNSKYVNSVPQCVLNLPSNVTMVLPSTRERRSQSRSALERSGVLKKLCMFCGKARKTFAKKYQKLRICMTTQFQTKVLEAAAILNDTNILSLAEQGDFVAKEFRYHDICEKRYKSKAAQAQGLSSPWHEFRYRHSCALGYICETIEQDILTKERMFSLKELTLMYNAKLDDPIPLTGIYRMKGSKLEAKLLSKYPSSLLVDRAPKNHTFYASSVKLTPSVLEAKMREMARDTALRNAAFELRKQIQLIERKPLPNSDLLLHHVVEGECTIPPALKSFCEDVIYGPTTSRDSDSSNRRSESISSDIIFAATNGRTRPQKQLMLGCVTKTVTGSKKLINVLNRLGHSVSYNTVGEIETELSYSSYKTDSLVPLSIIRSPSLYTSVAFNNFDRFVETKSGKDTLHDTVGIVFQNCMGTDGAQEEALGMSEPQGGKFRKKRRFEATMMDVEAYPKKPLFKVATVVKNPFEELKRFHTTDFRSLDIIWAMNFIYHQSKTPMWTGFNAQHCIDQSPLQKLAYLPQINHSPTSYAVVRHTLKQALQVADECGQEDILCTYDLNIAKMAMEIQSEDKPSFDHVFIMLGPFHIEMAFFKALGKLIDGSGVVEILQESGVLACGSSAGFIGGTNYNRCKRIHRLLSLSLRSLHYELFRNSQVPNNTFRDEIPALLLAAKNLKVTQSSEKLYLDSKLENHLDAYMNFEISTIEGLHGKTPQTWMIYIHFIDYYHDFVRSTRMGDINLFLKSILQIADLFFVMNHQNYARWLTPFVDNIINSLDIGGQIAEQFKHGFFTVRRTGKNFSRTPIDLTLEQTINADAANKLTGIVHSTNSISARQRWAYSHSQRTEMVSHFLRDLGLNAQEDVHTDLRPSRIDHDNQAYRTILEAIKGMINPFDSNLDQDYLYNLCTGKSASDEVQSFLKEVPQAGRDQHLKFREECGDDGSRFYRPLRKNIIKNFASESPTLTIAKNQKTCEIKMERNLLGRLLTISLREKIDLQAVLSFPLTPVPLSLGRADGSLVKTQKSVLLKILEGPAQDPLTQNPRSHRIPNHIDTVIVDGFYLIHLKANNFPSTYGGVAHDILKKLSMYKSPAVHLIFDRYPTPSIKDLERQARGEEHRNVGQYSIMNPQQKRPTNIMKELRDNSYKQNLVTFLSTEWRKNEYHTYFTKFSLYVTVGRSCFLFMAPVNEVICHEVTAFESGHEEADSRMVYHLSTVESGNVVIHTCDTDVLVIVLGNLHLISGMTEVWMETGTVTRNDHRYIHIRTIANDLGSMICKSLPAFHALTGCDYTSAFFRIGKRKPFNIFKKDEDLQTILSTFGDNAILTNDEFEKIQQFVCKMYSRKEMSNVNELRLHLFMDAYGKTSNSDPLKAPKGIDNMSLPPCEKVLRNHILRSKYVTKIWTNLNTANPPLITADNFGWELTANKLRINWFTGPALPDKLEEILLSSEKSLDSDELSDELSSSDEDE